MVGSTFGGNGMNIFGVPDCRGRARIPLDPTLSRVTAAGSGVSGNSLGATGGDQLMQTHTHGITDPTHSHSLGSVVNFGGSNIANGAGLNTTTGNTGAASTGITINNAGGGGSQNMPPTIVFGLTFIKT